MADTPKEKDKTKAASKGALAKISKNFRDMKGEMKRVVWPSKKQALNNTGVVLVFMAIMAVIIGIFDTGLTALIGLFFGFSS
ncbi:preprotein translocase subunit SecE [Ruminococcaceae bacterium OttesenSCG-928-L11]|nr:preprotein translocase subunit SecE [Ruminococcaceae bacterium OttesenSCG-928-L11]